MIQRQAATSCPRVGFLGVGWIGQHRMKAIAETGAVTIAAIADPSREMAAQAAAIAPQAALGSTMDDLFNQNLDGIVIATPSSLHAQQAIAALERGIAVFCQKPLGLNGQEVRRVLGAAETANRLLGIDLSYRHTAGMERIREIIGQGGIGDVFAVDLVFHNAYGPDKDWFYDPTRSGGGCLMDLGVHLVDLALWSLDFPAITTANGALFAAGKPLAGRRDRVEDYASASLTTEGGATIRLACSWRVHAGCDAEISATFFGTQGGLSLRNVGGSFYDFTAELYRGTSREVLVTPPDSWGGRAAIAWATRLAQGEGFDPQAWRMAEVADVLDRVYRSEAGTVARG